ncbi:MAG: permease [Desulfobacteraceae bacterium]|nr:permease [Desulfobacteraceae bacterium]
MTFDLPEAILSTAFDILNDASAWLVLSFALAGILHELLRPETLQRMMANRRISSILRGTLSGMLLPVCSCGVIPLGLGLYYSGAYLGPTLAFMTATPIINPAAVILAYGLLGPQIATIYLLSGFAVPMLTGLLGNAFGGPELQAPGVGERPHLSETSTENAGLGRRILSGLHWGFMDLGMMVSKYVVLGVLLAGLILALVPQHYIQEYLGNPGMISLAGIAVLGAVMYVCAVGHIPFIAALVAGGAAPGVAITFLMTGAASNLPELLSIYRLIGPRAVAVYALTLIGTSMLIGYMTNTLLLQDFMPFFDHAHSTRMVGIANRFILAVPKPVEYFFSIVVAALCVRAFLPRIRSIFAGEQTI